MRPHDSLNADKAAELLRVRRQASTLGGRAGLHGLLFFLAIIAWAVAFFACGVHRWPEVVLDLPPGELPFTDGAGRHVHCPEELNGGGYRGGKFTYIYQQQADRGRHVRQGPQGSQP